MKKIIAIGNALVDILARLEDEKLLSDLALPKGRMTLVSERQARLIREALQPYGPQFSTGGCAGNTAKALAGLQASPGFIGTVGHDEVGRFFAESFDACGIEAQLQEVEAHTGVACTLITPDGERTFGTCLGAAAMIRAEDITPEVLHGYDILHVEGYLVQDEALMENVVRTAKEAGLMLSLDLASPNVVCEYRTLFHGLVHNYFDIVFANEEESLAYTQELTPEASLKAMARDCMLPVVKLGGRGASALLNGECVSVPAHQATVVDTTGAGDFFAAGFLYGLACGAELSRCLQLGALLGGAVVQKMGTSLSAGEWACLQQEVRRILGTNQAEADYFG